MKLTFRYHPYPLTNFTKFQPGIYIYNIQSSKKIERQIEIRQRFHALTLKIVRPRFDYIAYIISKRISVAQHIDSSPLINCNRKLESVAKSSSYGYLPTPWWPCRVERDRRHYLLVSLFCAVPLPHVMHPLRSSMLIDRTSER